MKKSLIGLEGEGGKKEANKVKAILGIREEQLLFQSRKKGACYNRLRKLPEQGRGKESRRIEKEEKG